MGFSQDNGYVPSTFEELMTSVMENINTQFGTAYDYPSFVGTNFYKYFYALIQKLQENEVKTSEIFLYLQQYFTITNENIQRPVVTAPGLLTVFANAGYEASVKPPESGDAGKVYICVNLDEDDPDFEDQKLEVNTIIKDCTSAGVLSQGDQTSTITLTNGQAFDFSFALPDFTPIILKLTLTISENNMTFIDSDLDIKTKLKTQIDARYGLGKNFEPMRYWNQTDSPWTSTVLLEYSVDEGANWLSSVNDAEFDELFTFTIDDITVVEA